MRGVIRSTHCVWEFSNNMNRTITVQARRSREYKTNARQRLFLIRASNKLFFTFAFADDETTAGIFHSK